jgi:uncharacterized protein with GYD domain
MATYIATVKFTPQGMANVQDTCKRAAALKAGARKLGAKVRDVYWTMGAYDGLLVFEAPDDETAAALTLHVGALGNVQTQTSRAFTAAEMEKILAQSAK